MSQTRMTKQRMVILEELRKVDTHPTADEIYAMVRSRIPRISLGTVYRNLDLLAESGEILRLEAAGTQKRFDGNTMHHQHVRCIRCGRVGDVMHPLDVPQPERAAAKGFTILTARVEFEGICDHCTAHS
ncbi:transcriptional repressor [Nitratidesulfovibrio vulgaris]|uniref:Transcriptional regulator, Fur family n=3 Tax=Nitratidesulfovibrio vulgaris TaxID=881 RepID=Q726L2_NITV2|nr:transcriptional repressor [Nitratidesulfovibrio vulgaris]GEB80209.1 transcriptional repressor [Desulfovibrio desulfuricans]HBW16930.1 transcriptional repressor [Desulfovibrio sp.]AAB39990.1 ferric uptake regulatory protein homolog [Nitratidesulfovibrio vulgaris str. Hildenborough]AAS97566.1 transcriptional regulator, Fur family [Nitratidesulfovibrio vulgaris str. Hildenborough]ABM27307.1 ferric uptake regulator, Fur family [Nitratidesulfovibrio vulgaris DP4]